MRLTIDIGHTKPGVVVFTLKGSIDAANYELLAGEIRSVLAEPPRVLVLDMEGVDLITSDGIGTIMSAKTSLARTGGELTLSNLQPQVRKVFDIIRLLPTFKVFQNRNELDEYLAKIQRQMMGGEEG